MAIKARKTVTESVPAGNHLGRVLGILDLDLQPGYEYLGEKIEPQYKIMFTYELPGELMKDGRPFVISEEMKSSTHERSKMFARLRALDPTGEITHKGENISNLVNRPCMVDAEQNEKGYTNIKGISSVPNGFNVPELANSPYVFDWEEPDLRVFNSLPEFIQNKLKGGLNFEGSALHRALMSQATGSDTDEGY